MPKCVGDMEEGDEVTPPRPGRRIESRFVIAHGLRPHITRPPPSDIRYTLTSVSPGASHAATRRDRGNPTAKSSMLGPRNLPTRYQPRPATKPPTVSIIRVYPHHSGRHRTRGRPNSTIPMLAPGLRTRAISPMHPSTSLTYRRRYPKVAASKDS